MENDVICLKSIDKTTIMEKTRVLVTGAYGNLGYLTVLKLFKTPNVEITCFGRKSKNGIRKQKKLSKKGKFKTVWGDIRDSEAVKEAVKGQDVIIHMAALLVPKTEDNPELGHDINVNGLINIIGAAENLDPKPRFIFSSSVACMGPASPDLPPRKVTDPLIAVNVYGKTKIEGEKLLQESQLPWVILRISLSPPFVVSDYMMKYLFDIAVDQKVEFIDPRDTAEAFVNAIFVPDDQILGKTMFLGGGEKCRLTQGDFLKKQFGSMGIPMLPREAFFMPKSLEDWHFMHWLDTEESQRLLDYQNRTLDDYIEEYLKGIGFKRHIIKLLGKQAVGQFLKASPYYEEQSNIRA